MLIEKALQELKNTNHLSKETRNKILENVSKSKRFYIILNTIIIDQSYWYETFPNDFIYFEIVSNSINYINKDISEEEFMKFLNETYTYIENRINDGKGRAGYSALALIKLGHEIVSNEFYQIDELQPDSDPYHWSALFIGSLPYNEGYNDISNINSKLNKEYWLYFINNLNNDETLVVKLKTPNNVTDEAGELKREQPSLVEKNQIIASKITLLVNRYIQAKIKNGWKELIVENYLVSNNFSSQAFNETNKLDNTQIYLINQTINAREVCQDIKQKMYNSLPEEGAWFMMKIEIEQNNEYEIKFFYDTKFALFTKWLDPSDFKKEFELFPRNKKFTPKWLEDYKTLY